jgi:hypothetical protein
VIAGADATPGPACARAAPRAPSAYTMSILDRWKQALVRQVGGVTGDPPPVYREGGRVEARAGNFVVTLLSVDDPYASDVINGHCSDAYKAGDERLITFEVLLHNTSRTETEPVGLKFHLFDDDHFVHPCLGLDSRCREPRMVEGFLTPGTFARGWVTFCLPWARRPARLQFFTGYLSGNVAEFELAVVDPATLARRRAELVDRSGPR